MVHKVNVKLSVHQQYIVAFVLSCIDIAMLVKFVGRIKINQLLVFISLICLDDFLVLIESKVFTVNVLQQGEFLSSVVELLIGKHTVLDEYLQVVPFFLKFFTVFLEDLFQTVGYFFCNVVRYLFNIAVALQVRT